jgi:predicted MFS family arabinose efflux permease
VTAVPGSLEERRMIWLLAGIQFMRILDFVPMMPLRPRLMRLFELTPGDFDLLISVYMFGAASSDLVASTVVDRFDRRKALLTLIAGYGGFACGRRRARNASRLSR